MTILGYVTTAVLFFILGVVAVFAYTFYRGRKKTWDDSNIINCVRFLSHCILHSDDFPKMRYSDGSKPFWYLTRNEFSEVVKSRPREARK